MSLALSRQQGCLRALQYRLTLEDSARLPAFLRAAGDTGFHAAPRPGLPALRLVDDNEHELIIVLASARIQLRVSYLVPRDEREACALALTSRFIDAMHPARQDTPARDAHAEPEPSLGEEPPRMPDAD